MVVMIFHPGPSYSVLLCYVDSLSKTVYDCSKDGRPAGWVACGLPFTLLDISCHMLLAITILNRYEDVSYYDRGYMPASMLRAVPPPEF
jgi:hypothetical protein